jgi:hypothetical protein
MSSFSSFTLLFSLSKTSSEIYFVLKKLFAVIIDILSNSSTRSIKELALDTINSLKK